MRRTCVLTVDEQRNFEPDAFFAKLKAAGFEFVSERCPYVLKKPWMVHRLDDGTFEYRQGYDDEPAS
jgi:hypothetical protein